MKKTVIVILLMINFIVADLTEYHESNLHFTSDIYTEFAKGQDGNFLICPLSAQTILSLATVGARGETAEQLSKALRIPSDPLKIKKIFLELSPYLEINKTYELSTANKIYASNDIQLKSSYKDIAQNTFKADVQNIDFTNTDKAAEEINKWVESKTDNKIKDLIKKGSLDPDTRAVLVNAVYFQGKWLEIFGSAYLDSFYVTKTNVVNTHMMTVRSSFNYYYNKQLNVGFLEMPFIGGDATMTIALPKEKDGLADLEKHISNVISLQPYNQFDAIVSIPKFTMESDINFNSILKSLGAELPFLNGANFKEISDDPLKIESVVQKTFIEVTEEGVTAAAATAIIMIPESMPRVTFNADHPFIYYLRHKVHGVFFIGRFVKP